MWNLKQWEILKKVYVHHSGVSIKKLLMKCENIINKVNSNLD